MTLTFTGKLSGTPAAGTGGTYAITVKATNGVGTPATQSFTLTVDQAPVITSAGSTTFTVGTSGTFHATASGYPASAFGETGTLPNGVTLAGTGTLSGTPAATTGGSYPITITATNAVGTPATQSFTLTVDQAAAITAGALPLTVVTGQPFGYSFVASGNPTPTYALANGAPGWLSVDLTTGVLAGTPPAGTTSFTYSVTATNGIGLPATAGPFAVTVLTVPAAPTGVVATAGDGEATVSWSAPSTTGRTPVTSYTITTTPAGATCATTTALTCTVTGLTNGTAYTFIVTATNVVGPGPTSTPSAAVIPAAGPIPPTVTGATQEQGSSSSSPTGTATVALPASTPTAPPAISASGTGVGAITVAQYAGNPTTGAVSGGTGVFYDVKLAQGSSFGPITITVCQLGAGGQSITWWDGTAWVPFSEQTYSAATGCVTATVTATTSPTQAQLTGIPVAPSTNVNVQ